MSPAPIIIYEGFLNAASFTDTVLSFVVAGILLGLVYLVLLGAAVLWRRYGLGEGRLAASLDRGYQTVFGLPDCTPGNCYCRQTCAAIDQDERP